MIVTSRARRRTTGRSVRTSGTTHAERVVVYGQFLPGQLQIRLNLLVLQAEYQAREIRQVEGAVSAIDTPNGLYANVFCRMEFGQNPAQRGIQGIAVVNRNGRAGQAKTLNQLRAYAAFLSFLISPSPSPSGRGECEGQV